MILIAVSAVSRRLRTAGRAGEKPGWVESGSGALSSRTMHRCALVGALL